MFLGGGVQSDWNQNDETAADYVKNRPGGYDEISLRLLLEDTFTNGVERMNSIDISLAEEDIIFNIKIDGRTAEDYQSIYSYSSSTGYSTWEIGNQTFSEIDFYMILEISPLGETYFTFYFKDGESHKCAVQIYVPVPVNIQNKYLPNSLIRDISNSAVEIRSDAKGIKEYPSSVNTGKNALINGYKCKALSRGGQHSVLIGDNLVSEYSYLTIGYNNDSDFVDGRQASFVIGGGTNSKKRNIFAVVDDGGIVVPSSTKDSTKYFRITVDDTGAIKATEVKNSD